MKALANGVGAIGILGLLVTGGLIARLGHVYNFYVYPDSYYYLLIAKNLAEGGELYGRLGPAGMHFPPVASAVFKPVYPLAVALADVFLGNLESSGHFVAIAASVASIPLAYLLARNLFSSRMSGLFAAALVAFSLNHVFWSGFIMSDSVSVALFFAVLVLGLRRGHDTYADPRDLAFGALLGLLFLSRLTYLIVLPLLAWIMISDYGWSRYRLLTAASACLVTYSAAAAILLPPIAPFLRVLSRHWDIALSSVALLLALAVLGILLQGRWSGGPRRRRLKVAGAGALGVLAVLPVLVELANLALTIGGRTPFYPALHKFVSYDPLLSALFAVGAILLIVGPQRHLGLFCALGVTLLIALYSQVAGWEFRYLVHLLPFVIIPAAYSMTRGVQMLRGWREYSGSGRLALGVSFALLIWAALSTASESLRPTSASQLRTSYFREVARNSYPSLTKRHRDMIFVAVTPWPYSYHFGVSAWGIDANDPARTLRHLPRQGSFLIVDDFPMRSHFPSLARGLAADHGDSAILDFTIARRYQYAYFARPRDHRVVFYELSRKELDIVLNQREKRPGSAD